MQESGFNKGILNETIRLFCFIVCHLVDDEGAVQVQYASTAERGVTLQVKCAPADFGKLIGAQGRTARSLRTVLGAASVKQGARYSLDIRPADLEP